MMTPDKCQETVLYSKGFIGGATLLDVGKFGPHDIHPAYNVQDHLVFAEYLSVSL